MKITVHEGKVRAELQTSGTYRDRPNRLTGSELEVLLAVLKGGKMRDFGEATGRSADNVSQMLGRVRAALNVRNNTELAYLAYERGYVVIEEGA